ncbi:unnamed protein product [Mytilus coruscus]|uniref:Uncharacterized protein n=1 Tax=Mytilus coruscus TaxID=42192 RepID=A0A6J8DBS0_MYTCO|nr:unnamed protein product [Mytilus coruscus]
MDKVSNTAEEIFKENKSSILWLGGDLNLPDIDWTSNSVSGNKYSTQINNRFVDMVNNCCLDQVVTFPTRGSATLDIFLTNRPSLVNRCEPIPGIGDHDIVFIDSNTIAMHPKPTQRKIYIWKRADIEKMKSEALELSKIFHGLYNAQSSISEMWEFIKSGLKNIQDKNVPSKMSSTRFHQPWINGTIKRIKRRKKKAFKKARTTKSTKDLKRYKTIKKSSQKECKKAYSTYIRDIISPEQKSSPKKFWSFIKNKRCENGGVAPLRNTDGLTYSDNKMKANILNNQFSSVFNSNEDKTTIKKMKTNPYPHMENITIWENGIHKLLSNLNIHKASGPDEISTRLLKSIAPEISPILTTFFQASVDQGTLPSDWKNANPVTSTVREHKERFLVPFARTQVYRYSFSQIPSESGMDCHNT